MSIHSDAASYAESQIERKLIWSMLDMLGFRALLDPARHVADMEGVYRSLLIKKQTVIMSPQAAFCGYRVDIALFGLDDKGAGITRIVECDGKAFHTKPWQVERDKRRDKFMTQWGADVIRLTGSEIHRDPDLAAAYALLPFFNKHWSSMPASRGLVSKYGWQEDVGQWSPVHMGDETNTFCHISGRRDA